MRMIHAAVLVTVVPVVNATLLQAVDMIELQAGDVMLLQAVDMIELQAADLIPLLVDDMIELQGVDAIPLLAGHVIQPRVDREQGVRLTACRIKYTFYKGPGNGTYN